MARIIGEAYSFDDVLIVPKYNKVKSRRNVNFRTKVTRNYFINIPILAASMDTICESKMAIAIGKLGGLGVIHRFLTIEEQAKQVDEVKQNNLITAAAIGIKDLEARVRALNDVGVNILVLDIAHGHSKYAGKSVDYIKENYPRLDVMAGNIATKDAAEYFLNKGADAVKVGIGPGATCTTRKMTGFGIPQITAIMDVYEATQGRIPICADGGIREPGDLVKAIGAGADAIMSGYLFAGTEEASGETVMKRKKIFKIYRGMASYDATMKKIEIDGKTKDSIISIEGKKILVPYKGSIKKIIEEFLGGLASGMTYMGASEIEQLKGKADFYYVTSAGRKENTAENIEEF